MPSTRWQRPARRCKPWQSGPGSCTGGSDGTLQQIANGTGGQCREVEDPGNLPDIIPDLVSSSLDALQISVDGAAATPIGNADIDPDLPVPGAASVSYATTVSGLGPGDHTICVTAKGSDAAGSGNVTQCEAIHLYRMTLAPDGAVNGSGQPARRTLSPPPSRVPLRPRRRWAGRSRSTSSRGRMRAPRARV